MVSFEYDKTKSAINKEKHGIDFVEAQALWHDEDVLELTLITEDEQRSIIIGKIGTKHWTAIITHRANNIRIISVRRSRKKERQAYESA